jgi:hypothetical protein
MKWWYGPSCLSRRAIRVFRTGHETQYTCREYNVVESLLAS